ncbi:hypothetical protein OAR43_02565 [Gammaproteobacteria bacterium]|nr:hypothetical protein [Gammaproteobacteria bacterium]
MKKHVISFLLAFSLSGLGGMVSAEEGVTNQQSAIDQYTQMLSNYMNSVSTGAQMTQPALGGFNPMAMINPMSMMGGMGWGGQPPLGAQRMMNPANWMNPQTYAYMMSPQAMGARVNPMNWMSMMNPATYAPLMNPMAYMTMMGQAINPTTYIEMTKLLMTPEMYTQWYDATVDAAADLASTAKDLTSVGE